MSALARFAAAAAVTRRVGSTTSVARVNSTAASLRPFPPPAAPPAPDDRCFGIVNVPLRAAILDSAPNGSALNSA
jgi:hypothetical protein